MAETATTCHRGVDQAHSHGIIFHFRFIYEAYIIGPDLEYLLTSVFSTVLLTFYLELD